MLLCRARLFRYDQSGLLATIGKNAAVADLRRVRIGGA
jgi:NADH dehydrogenase FAD-containing subunit